MDIVTRLKSFINYAGVPVTQFADNCRIARPTLSQLLNGRNKKVSDELISKIHEAYPQLSVLWLMFGEGDMLHESSAQISEPKNGSLFDFSEAQPTEDESPAATLDFKKDFENQSPSTLTTHRTDAPAVNSVNLDMGTTSHEQQRDGAEPTTTLSFSADSSKKIVNIIVYYNDNSFESFVPAPEK